MEEKPSTQAYLALALSLLGCLGCGGCVTAIIGAIIGKMELGKIDRGESPEAGRTFAKVGFILGTVVTILSVLFTIAYVIFVVVMGASGNF